MCRASLASTVSASSGQAKRGGSLVSMAARVRLAEPRRLARCSLPLADRPLDLELVLAAIIRPLGATAGQVVAALH